LFFDNLVVSKSGIFFSMRFQNVGAWVSGVMST